MSERRHMKRFLKQLLVTVLLLQVLFINPAFAESDPLKIILNLSDFIFSIIRAVGMIMLGFGIVQIGLSL